MTALGRNQPLPDFDLRPEGDSPQPLMPSCSHLKTRRSQLLHGPIHLIPMIQGENLGTLLPPLLS